MTLVAESVKDKIKRLSGTFYNDDDNLIIEIVKATMSHFNRYTNVPANQEIEERYSFIIVDVASRFYAERRKRFTYDEAKAHFEKFLPILKEDFTFTVKGIAKRGEQWSAWMK